MLKELEQKKVVLAIGTIWLFHVSAMIGIGMGHLDWFITKTDLNLSLCLFLFLICYPLDNLRKVLAFGLFFTGGFLAEWIGVHYGILFGEYAYGANFGPKIDGIPLLIGTNWAVLTFITAGIMDYFNMHTALKVSLATALMVLLDYFMEYSAPIFDFWTFEGGLAGLENYLTWFGLALLFQVVLKGLKVSGNRLFSAHLYLAQLVFFMYFYFLSEVLF
ncbi:carotenoid biosynthesis protein [Maribacter sp. 2307ULW6-5]|uniref:carotenoid biosynthesis protein n=1 Tax=Maribacter sp. 2307ULW6-5 TaxID=3386275 RepID=UPI0039BD129C